MAALQGFPFESTFTGYDDEGNPVFDRAVSSAAYRSFWKTYFGNGIFFAPATNFHVTAAGGMSVDVQHGEAHVEGLTVLADGGTTRLTLPKSSSTAARTDLIVLRADFTAGRSVAVVVKPGASAVSDLQRDASAWELGLASVHVGRGVSTIEQMDITDLRLNSSFCGQVVEPITRTNTDAFFTQMAQMIAEYGRRWDQFYADVNADTANLLNHVQIQPSQVIGLTAMLSAQDQAIAAQLAAQNQVVTTALADAQTRIIGGQFDLNASGWTPISGQYTRTHSIPGLPANSSTTMLTIGWDISAMADVGRYGVGAYEQPAGGIVFRAQKLPMVPMRGYWTYMRGITAS